MGRTWSLALFLALAFAACATVPLKPWVLSSEGLDAPAAGNLKEIASHPQALATTLGVVRRDLALPVPPVELHFLPDARRLREVLLASGYPPGLARDAARQMVAIGGHRAVLINQARFDSRPWSWRVAVLAHELCHVLQYELGGGERGASAQWLREGFAEWLMVHVVERLEGTASAEARQQAILRLRAPQESLSTLGGERSLSDWVERPRWTRVPPLSRLGSFPDWVGAAEDGGGEGLYLYAFVAAGSLIEQHGVPAIVRYFERFATRQDRPANFVEVFGESEEQFDGRLRRAAFP